MAKGHCKGAQLMLNLQGRHREYTFLFVCLSQVHGWTGIYTLMVPSMSKKFKIATRICQYSLSI